MTNMDKQKVISVIREEGGKRQILDFTLPPGIAGLRIADLKISGEDVKEVYEFWKKEGKDGKK